MLRKLSRLLLFLFVLGIGQSLAQKVEISQTERSIRRMNAHVFGETQDGFYAIKTDAPIYYDHIGFVTREDKPLLQFYDNTMTKLWEQEVNMPSGNTNIINVMVIGNKIRMFFTSPDNGKENLILFARNFALNSGNEIGETVVLGKIPYDKRKVESFFRIVHNRDMNKLVALGFVPNEKNGAVTVHLNWLNGLLEPFAQYQEKIVENKDVKLELTDFAVDNGNNVYFLAREFPVNKKRTDFGKYRGFFGTPISNGLTRFDFEKEHLKIEELVMSVDNVNNRMVLSGFFTEVKDYPNSGVLYANFDPVSKSLSEISYRKFSAKFLNDFTDINRMNAGRNLINYNIRNLITRGDGGGVLIAESSFVSESSTFNVYSQMYSTSYTFHSNNVIVFSISPTGTIDWEQVVRKRQISENDGGIYNSFAPFLYKDRLIFLYNEAIKRKADVQGAEINFRGEFDENPVITSKKDLVIMPEGARQISATEIVIPCLHRSQEGFVKITF